jgi:site-specific DNA-methyltransferase (adenine-specific)
MSEEPVLRLGDCLEVLHELEPDSIEACVTDPPYHLTTGKKGGTGEASLNLNSPAGRARISTGFMGKAWDGGDIAFQP